MTPKEKAEELINKFRPHSKYWDCFNDEPLEENHAKQCALIAVDEIIYSYPHTYDIEKDKTKDNEDVTIIMNVRSNIGYWQEVKEEINKL
jgi:hypothetical protein